MSRAEVEVMKVVWEGEPVSVAEVLEVVNGAREEPVARNTVLVQMQRLEEKGWLSKEKAGRGFRYRATVGREAAQAEMARDFERAVFDGSTASLVRCLVDGDGLDAGEIEELRKIIDAAEGRVK